MVKPTVLKAKDLRMFAVVPIRAIRDPRLTPRNFQVLVAFCSYADHMGRTFVSQARVGEDLGLHGRTICTHVKKLRELGYITYAKPLWRGQRSTSNRIVFDPQVKNEETIRSRLSAKQQMELAEAETIAKERYKINKRATNTQPDDRVDMLSEKFQQMCKQFLTGAIAEGVPLNHNRIERTAKQVTAQIADVMIAAQENHKRRESYVGS